MWREVYRDSRSSSLEQSLENSGMENKAFEDVDLEGREDETKKDAAEKKKAEAEAGDVGYDEAGNGGLPGDRRTSQLEIEHDGPYAGKRQI